VDAFEVVDPTMPERLIALTEQAVAAFRHGAVHESLELWQTLEEEFGASKLSERYRKALAGAGADGEDILHLEEK
jgi:hypothetical protein